MSVLLVLLAYRGLRKIQLSLTLWLPPFSFSEELFHALYFSDMPVYVT